MIQRMIGSLGQNDCLARLGRALRILGHHERGESGQAMIEMAITLPLLLLILFAIFEFGLAFARLQIVSNAAREGARAATLFLENCTEDAVTDRVQTAVELFEDRLGMGALSFTVSGAGGGGDLCTSETIQVAVTFDHEIPVVSGLSGLIVSSQGGQALPATIPLTGTTRMMNERQSVADAG